jgi:hypothetical protein
MNGAEQQLDTSPFRPERFIWFALLCIPCTLLVTLGYGIAGTDDDIELWNYLIAGENGTWVLSYSFSFIVQNLYSLFPGIQWYSWLIFLVVVFNNYLIAIHLENTQHMLNKILFAVISQVFVVYIITHYSITIVTVYTLACAVLILPHSVALFIATFVLGTFLRTNVAIPVIPFILTAVLLHRGKFLENKKTIGWLLAALVVITGNIFSHKLDKTYSRWYDFHSAHAAYHDFKGPMPARNTLPPAQKQLANGWWVQDAEIMPYDAYVEGKPTFLETVELKLQQFEKNDFLEHRYRYLLLFLVLCTIVTGLRRGNLVNFGLALVITFGFFLSLVIRDEERVTIPLLFLWFVVIYQVGRWKPAILAGTLAISLYYLQPDFSMESVDRSLALREEAEKLVTESNVVVEGSIRFPTNWRQTKYLYGYYQLFREDTWINYSEGKFLPFGWSFRHRIWYRMHNISKGDIKRKYNNYYEFLMDPGTGFIGDHHMIKSRKNQLILSLYDEKYLTEEQRSQGCRHITRITNKSRHLSISKIILECENS